ncbi:MAG TPA: hypothetical protein VNF07_04590 [Acidimicrobiales bacterium]|nr:hypothetical protein [Acidimicrobiales bacterium]
MTSGITFAAWAVVEGRVAGGAGGRPAAPAGPARRLLARPAPLTAADARLAAAELAGGRGVCQGYAPSVAPRGSAPATSRAT